MELFEAVEGGDVEKIKELLQQDKYDVNRKYCDKQGKHETLLNCACKKGQLGIVKVLLSEFQTDVNSRGYYGYTPLLNACRWGHLDIVQALLSEFKADLSIRDATGCTALLQAARGGHEDVVIALLRDYHCPVTDTDRNGRGVLHYACVKGNVSMVRTLIRNYKANFTFQNQQKNVPLQIAINDGFFNVAFCLIFEFGYDPNIITDYWGQTPLHYACKKDDSSDLIRALVQEHKANVNACDKNKSTPLHVAVKEGKHEAALALIGCDPNIPDMQGKTPLHYACQRGDINLVRVLVQNHKADLDVRDKLMITPLQVALFRNKPDTAFCLIFEFGCNPNMGGRQGRTLLHLACESGDLDLIHTLVHNCKADVTVCDEKGDTPLHVAASAGHYDVVLALVNEYDCDPTAQGYKARTPLHMASEAGHIEIAQVLLKFTSPMVIDERGYTPLHLASHSGHQEIVQVLLKFTSPLVTNKRGHTPLHLASAYDHALTVECLLKANAPVFVRNDYGLTALEVAKGESKLLLDDFTKENRQQILADYKRMSKQADKRFSGSHYITRVFVIGNPGAGKSSFIESLKREGFFQSFSKVSESSVPPHTAGIIPSVYTSKQYGRVLFYDFAGDLEYYSSHAAIFERFASSKWGNNIFIIVVDMQDVAIETTLHYWFNFIDYQKFRKASFIVVGSHLDLSIDQSVSFDQFCASMQASNVQNIKHFMMDCRDPRSDQIAQFKKHVSTWVCESQKYELSSGAKLLLGLLEKDFSAVTACSVQTLVSHIKQAGIWLPVESKPLHTVLLELHEVGAVLLLGDCTKDTDHVILNTAKLTNKVHELLFSGSALANIKNAAHFNIGVLPQEVLQELLPPYITTECLLHLQYCQQINHSDVGAFPILEEDDSSQSFLFFPALCNVDKGQVPWDESAGTSFTIGWLALCTRPHDYFPPRFLHVLLLRLVYGFTLSPSRLQTAHASPEHSRRCTMWKKGVHWKMKEGVDCMVELVNGSKGVVVFCKSSSDRAETCSDIFTKVVCCVMETKAKFCYSTKPDFFLLDSSDEADYLNEDHLFALSELDESLQRPSDSVLISVSGRGEIELSKLQCMLNLTHWNKLFPITCREVLHTLEEVVDKIFDLGLKLGASWAFLESLRADFPSDLKQRRIELVSWWMKSSPNPPCWYTLVEALKDIEMGVLAAKVKEKHSLHIKLQEKLLAEESKTLKPDTEFLYSLSQVVESRWPSLAVPLKLSEGEIEGLKRKVGLSQQKLALQMLMLWSSKEEATYGLLCLKLRTISFSLTS